LHQILRDLHDAEYAFASLYPFSYPFYEKMGWAATHWQYDITVASEWVKNAAKRGNAKAFRMAGPKQFNDAVAIYDRWYKHFNLNLSRSESKFSARMEWPGRDYRLLINDDGFMVLDLEKSDRNAGILRVPEFVYLNDQCYLDGLAFLGQMDAQFEKVNWIDWDVDKLLSLGVPYPRPEINRSPAMMTRVVNDKAFYKLLPKQLKLKLSDPLEVTWSNDGDIGVGEILQVLTGFFSKPGKLYPELYNMVGGAPAFCIERY
jgi:predicted acetyltransferase